MSYIIILHEMMFIYLMVDALLQRYTSKIETQTYIYTPEMPFKGLRTYFHGLKSIIISL